LSCAMSTLLQQTRAAPMRDGPDTVISCQPSVRRRPQWGSRKGPLRGQLWAHAFVLVSSCGSVQMEPPLDARSESSEKKRGPSPDLRTCTLCLRRCNPTSVARYKLDLGEVATDVASAWLQYLYTQEDLTLVWPCRGDTQEDTQLAERFWTELLQLAQQLGDSKLQLYAQDTLVEALRPENWTAMAAFAEQAQSPLLLEAATMMGVRILMPHMLRSFRVPSGLERGTLDSETTCDYKYHRKMSGRPSVATSAGEKTPLRPGPSLHSTIDVDLEGHLAELSASGPPSLSPAMMLTLKRGSPSAYLQMKQRLVDGVAVAQRTSAQLQRCMHFFDSQEKSGFRDEGTLRSFKREVALLLLFFGLFFLTPVALRQEALGFLADVVEPVRAKLAFYDLGWLSPSQLGFLQTVGINIIMFGTLCWVVWSGLAA